MNVKTHNFIAEGKFKSLLLRQQKTNFCLPDESSFFHIFGTFSGKIRQNQGKIREITRCSGHWYCHSVIFMPAAARKSTLLFVVLCSNKERQKHCVVRELNQKAYKLFQTRTKLYSFPIYKCARICYTVEV